MGLFWYKSQVSQGQVARLHYRTKYFHILEKKKYGDKVKNVLLLQRSDEQS